MDLGDDVHDVSIDDDEVEIAVVVVIEEFGTEVQRHVTGMGQASSRCRIAEFAPAVVGVERVRLAGEVGHVEIEGAVVVDITKVDPHAVLGQAVGECYCSRKQGSEGLTQVFSGSNG